MWLSAVVLVVVSSRVVISENQPWWSNAVYYRILVDSFKDADGDGLGDIQGTTKQLSYIRALGADAVILSPLSVRSTDCSRPGPINFDSIDPRYGNLDGFNGLLEKAKKLELKVVISLEMQTISTSSEWFQSSVSRSPGFEDRVLWQDGTADQPPAAENHTVWIWDESRNAYWASANEEAVLNLCSESTIAALSAAQCAWLRRGVAGVVLSPDYSKSPDCGAKLAIKLVIDAMSCARGANMDTPVILVESSLPAEESAKYYGDGVGVNSVISNVLFVPTRAGSAGLAAALLAAVVFAPQDTAPTWLTSARNESRIATRYGSEMVDAINTLALILPGAAIIQQGDELGTADTILEWASSTNCWPYRASPSAAPFPWSDGANAGFTAGEPWVPLAPNYRYANAKTEFANELSHVGVVRVAAAMRKSPAFGPHNEIKRLGEALVVLRWGDTGSLLFAANFGKDQYEVQLARVPGIPSEMTIAASSAGSRYSSGSHVATEKAVKLAPDEAVLLAGPPRHCGGPGPVDKIANKLSDGWQKINKYFSNL